jgi:hypothetical protein
MLNRVACLAALTLAAGSAHAAFFSFASGSASGAWTFTGSGANFSSGLGAMPVTFLIDDRNGVLPTIQVSSRFEASITLSHAGSLPLGGGTFSHNYLANGSFTLIDAAAGTPLLTTQFNNALFTARGGEASWFTTAALQGDGNGNGSVNMMWSGANLPGYGLTPGPLAEASFAFAMAALNTSGAIPYNFQNPGAPLGAGSLPSTTWWSEASFTAAAIPAPGAGMILLMAGAFAARRRR